jgi:hypothetical protein
MRVQKRRSARPRKAERSETTAPLTYIIAEGEVNGNGSVSDRAARRHIGECPLCHSPGKLTVEPRRSAPRRWWVNCWTAGCRAQGSGEWAREVAAVVGAPGGGALLADPLRYLSDYLETETRTDRDPEQLPTLASIHGRASRLFTVPDAIGHLLTKRGLTERTLRRARVGWDGSAFTFPIYDAQGELVNLIRRPWPDMPDGRKYVTLRGRNRHNGGVELYPRPLPRGSWLLVEGLLDALLGRQHGLPAVTSTHGVDTFLEEWLPLVRGRRVAVMYDVGAEAVMRKRVAQLCAAGAQAWPVRLRLILPKGKSDLSDYLNGSGTKQDLKELIEREGHRWKP